MGPSTAPLVEDPNGVPPGLSRRALLGGALASAGLLAVAAACGSSGGAEADPLKALGRAVAKSPDGSRLRSSPPDGLATPIPDQAHLLDQLASLDDRIRADFAEGRTVLAEGWLLAETEAAALVAYARG